MKPPRIKPKVEYGQPVTFTFSTSETSELLAACKLLPDLDRVTADRILERVQSMRCRIDELETIQRAIRQRKDVTVTRTVTTVVNYTMGRRSKR